MATDNRLRPLVIGFSQRRLAGSAWWKTLVDGATEAASLGNATIDLRDANGDTSRQIEDVLGFIDRRVDAVVLNPNDPRRIARAIDALADAGIPVVVVNSNLDGPLVGKVAAYVAEDQVLAGSKAGYLMAAAVTERFGTSGTVETVMIGGYPWDLLSDMRSSGFLLGYEKWLAEHDGAGMCPDLLPMQYGHWLSADVQPLMREVCRTHPNLRVVVSLSDIMHAGIEHALKAEGLFSKVLIAEYDGLMSSVQEMVDDPSGPLQVMVTNEPRRQGVEAVELAIAAATGSVPATGGAVRFVASSAFRAADARRFLDPAKSFVDTLQ
jgi:ribose transport system substrate-binding protein